MVQEKRVRKAQSSSQRKEKARADTGDLPTSQTMQSSSPPPNPVEKAFGAQIPPRSSTLKGKQKQPVRIDDEPSADEDEPVAEDDESRTEEEREEVGDELDDLYRVIGSEDESEQLQSESAGCHPEGDMV
ncbi:hypothetical protein FRB90_000461 [Tulasnella sp. 427]|nr:hypothetical protein FRB90_000461 [Tulasnella sp. 427]